MPTDPDNLPRVLVIDEDAELARSIADSLAPNCRVLVSQDGASALDLALKERPDLIILSAELREMDGFQVLYLLRQHPLAQSIPVVVLTAPGDLAGKLRGMELGADDYLVKPIDLAELRIRVISHLERRERYLQASPLTGLPGNPAIDRVLSARLAAGEPLAVLYLDLGNFKAFNDRYGWVAGNEVLRELADILVRAVLEQGDKEDFVGHIGGDDFVAITRPERAEAIAQQVVARFDEAVAAHYNTEDRERGYIVVRDRVGVDRRFPFVAVVIAIVSNRDRALTHSLQVGQLAAQVMAFLKQSPGSRYGFDRRKS